MKARYRWASVIGALMLTAMTGACSWARNDVDLARAPEQGTWGVHPQAGLGAVCRQTIAAARQRLQALPTTSMMVVVDGKQLFGYGALDRPSIVYSVRKSILAMLYGRYVDSGVIDLDRTLGELGIDDTGGLLPVERRARLRDLLASRSGVYHAAANPGDDADHVPPRGRRNPAATSSTTTGTSMRRAPLSRWRRARISTRRSRATSRLPCTWKTSNCRASTSIPTRRVRCTRPTTFCCPRAT